MSLKHMAKWRFLIKIEIKPLVLNEACNRILSSEANDVFLSPTRLSRRRKAGQVFR